MLLESKEHGSSDDNDFISDWINSEPVPFVKNVRMQEIRPFDRSDNVLYATRGGFVRHFSLIEI